MQRRSSSRAAESGTRAQRGIRGERAAPIPCFLVAPAAGGAGWRMTIRIARQRADRAHAVEHREALTDAVEGYGSAERFEPGVIASLAETGQCAVVDGARRDHYAIGHPVGSEGQRVRKALKRQTIRWRPVGSFLGEIWVLLQKEGRDRRGRSIGRGRRSRRVRDDGRRLLGVPTACCHRKNAQREGPTIGHGWEGERKSCTATGSPESASKRPSRRWSLRNEDGPEGNLVGDCIAAKILTTVSVR